jgi:hypothetical protein
MHNLLEYEQNEETWKMILIEKTEKKNLFTEKVWEFDDFCCLYKLWVAMDSHGIWVGIDGSQVILRKIGPITSILILRRSGILHL